MVTIDWYTRTVLTVIAVCDYACRPSGARGPLNDFWRATLRGRPVLNR